MWTVESFQSYGGRTKRWLFPLGIKVHPGPGGAKLTPEGKLVLLKNWPLFSAHWPKNQDPFTRTYLKCWSRFLARPHFRQGDQIGPSQQFAQGTIVYFGQFFWKLQKLPTFLCYFCPKYIYRLCIDFDKNVLGYILGEFYTKLIWSPWLQSRVHTWILGSLSSVWINWRRERKRDS
jgi:hypothetical protein